MRGSSILFTAFADPMNQPCQSSLHMVSNTVSRGRAIERTVLWHANFMGRIPFQLSCFFLISSSRKIICLSKMSYLFLITFRNLLQQSALFHQGALSSLKAGIIINGISLQQISRSVYTASPGGWAFLLLKNSQDSNVFPSGRVLIWSIFLL